MYWRDEKVKGIRKVRESVKISLEFNNKKNSLKKENYDMLIVI